MAEADDLHLSSNHLESATPRDSSEATGDRTATENNAVSDVGDDDNDEADEDGAVGGVDDDCVFGNETAAATKSTNAQGPSPRRLPCENQEEVDDIELIFSSDDKELPQEDLVSISYYEPWHSIGQSGTPVLIGFGKLGSEAERTGDTDASEHEANLSPSPIDPDKFYKAIEKSVLAHEQQQLELCMGSVDSLDIGDGKRIVSDFYGRIKSLDMPTATVNDENDLRRDESFDTFEMEQVSEHRSVSGVDSVPSQANINKVHFSFAAGLSADGPTMDQLQCAARNGYLEDRRDRGGCCGRRRSRQGPTKHVPEPCSVSADYSSRGARPANQPLDRTSVSVGR